MAGTPKLIVLSEQFRGRTFELNKDQLTVGRVDERDICIKDPTISTYHCKFIRSDNSFIVEDEGSTNGTRVNNEPITRPQKLQNSDILQIGGVELLYDCDDKSVTTIITTQTGIDIRAADQTQSIRRVTQSGFSEKKRSAFSLQKIMLGIILLLFILVIALLIFLIIFTSGSSSKSGEVGAVVSMPILAQSH